MEVIPLFGTDFNVYAPIIIFIVGSLTLFNIYARILKLFGIENEDAVTGGCLQFQKLDAGDLELISIGKKQVTSQIKLLPNFENSAMIIHESGFGETVNTLTDKDTSALLSIPDGSSEVLNRIINSTTNPLSGKNSNSVKSLSAVEHKINTQKQPRPHRDISDDVELGIKSAVEFGKQDYVKGYTSIASYHPSFNEIPCSEVFEWGSSSNDEQESNSLSRFNPPAKSVRNPINSVNQSMFADDFVAQSGLIQTNAEFPANSKLYGGRYSR